jgi:hypothetical protein
VTLLALKLLLAPAFVVVSSLVARRFGVRVGGVVGGLPAIAGPILLVLALAHGAAFAARAATGTLLGIVALVAFVVAYVAVSHRRTWPWAVGLGWTSFFVAVAALRPVHVGAVVALALTCGACAATLAALPRPNAPPPPPRRYPRWDLPLRAACAAVPVLVITASARALGPQLTGLLAAFPIITPVLAAFTQAQQGPTESDRLLRGMTAGFFSYALFCFAVAVTVEELGVAASFALATVVALATQAAAIAVARRREQPMPVEAPA